MIFNIANINILPACFVELPYFNIMTQVFLLHSNFDNFVQSNKVQMERTIRVKDKDFSIFIKADEIDSAVKKLADQINIDVKDEDPIFLVILNGAFMFAADLLKKVNIKCSVSFVKLASYSGTQSSNMVKELIGLTENIEGRSVIIVEDIIDTGKTLEVLLNKLKDLGVGKVRLAALLHKPDAFLASYPIDYVGINIPNEFIVGYGLDYDGYARNFPDIYKIVE